VGDRDHFEDMPRFENDIKMDRQEVGWGHALNLVWLWLGTL